MLCCTNSAIRLHYYCNKIALLLQRVVLLVQSYFAVFLIPLHKYCKLCPRYVSPSIASPQLPFAAHMGRINQEQKNDPLGSLYSELWQLISIWRKHSNVMKISAIVQNCGAILASQSNLKNNFGNIFKKFFENFQKIKIFKKKFKNQNFKKNFKN